MVRQIGFCLAAAGILGIFLALNPRCPEKKSAVPNAAIFKNWKNVQAMLPDDDGQEFEVEPRVFLELQRIEHGKQSSVLLYRVINKKAETYVFEGFTKIFPLMDDEGNQFADKGNPSIHQTLLPNEQYRGVVEYDALPKNTRFHLVLHVR